MIINPVDEKLLKQGILSVPTLVDAKIVGISKLEEGHIGYVVETEEGHIGVLSLGEYIREEDNLLHLPDIPRLKELRSYGLKLREKSQAW